jgi:hypothetical protein
LPGCQGTAAGPVEKRTGIAACDGFGRCAPLQEYSARENLRSEFLQKFLYFSGQEKSPRALIL